MEQPRSPRSSRSRLPIACTLDAVGAQGQLDEWASLRRLCRRSETTARGATLWFDPAAEAALRSVAAKEAACCGFLQLDVRTDRDSVRLDIASDQPEALPVIELLARQAAGASTR